MDEKTIEALKGSITKWEKNAEIAKDDVFSVDTSDETCALCNSFLNFRSDVHELEHCRGCPVSARTGKAYCEGSPYIRVVAVIYDIDENGLDRNFGVEDVVLACQEEVDFLKSLMPTDAPA